MSIVYNIIKGSDTMPQGKIAPHKTSTAIRLTKVLKSELEYLAKQDHRSLNNYMETVLTDHVEQQRRAGKIPKNIEIESIDNSSDSDNS